jgi:hypothetical protein
MIQQIGLNRVYRLISSPYNSSFEEQYREGKLESLFNVTSFQWFCLTKKFSIAIKFFQFLNTAKGYSI